MKKHNDYSNLEYKPVQFLPTNPYDDQAGITNVIAYSDKNNSYKIYTTENELIEDYSIVEFKYISTNENNFKWVPVKNRYDKTFELRNGSKNYGNAYHVANSNWQTINNPITYENITTGNNISIDNNDDDVYYNKISNTTYTRALRDFHNLFVKNLLINSVSKDEDTIIDYAVGKAGDLPKWINNKLKFVFGIDLSKDNIENRIDGACARYLNYSKKFNKLPNVLFVNGDSSKNIKNTDAIFSDKYKIITKAVFGMGIKNDSLGKGVYKNYGIAKNGFNISSIQFGLHYMFENEDKLHGFLNNVSECTALNGYFIGTCFNGTSVFNMLKSINKGESLSLFNQDNKIWEITKNYDHKEFNNDESCLGYEISIFQETINKKIKEYLVNFDYLTRLLENYGFCFIR